MPEDFGLGAPRRILLTGAAGFVGRHAARELIRVFGSGLELRCLVRASSRTDLLPPEARLCYGDLERGTGLDEALNGMDEGDCVIHLAAVLFASSWREYLRGNTALASRLGAAVRRSGVGRVLMVSSLAATGPSGTSPGVEDDAVPAPVSAYGWSKYAAELVLAKALDDPQRSRRLVVLRPPIIYGPGDKGLLPYFKTARLGLVVTPAKNLPVSLVHVDDAVRGLLCCLKPEARGVYHLNDGAEHSMRSLGEAMCAAFGRKARVLPVPRPLLALSAGAASLGAWLGLPQSPWNIDKFLESGQAGWLCAGARIRDELGHAPAVPLREGVAQSMEGYRRMGML